MKRFIRWIVMLFKAKPGDWMDGSYSISSEKPPRGVHKPLGEAYDPDRYYEQLASSSVESPVSVFNRDLMAGKVEVLEAWLWEGKMDRRGKLISKKVMKESNILPYRTRLVEGNKAYKQTLKAAEATFRQLPKKAAALEEAKRKFEEGVARLKQTGVLKEDSFSVDGTTTNYDLGQYTEYAPTYGGPFNKQLYLSDYLKMHSLAFEAKNHNPLAKRIVDVMAQYAFGRRFKVRIKDGDKKKAWEDFEQKYNIIHRCSEFWVREYLTYGELMLNKENWQSVDPSTVWDIITDPDDITNVYYYYQSYSTAFQSFTGYRVNGANAEKVDGMKYIIRQLPADQIIHIKGNVVSQEKRGRSILFPVLGWLKRVRDLYSAEIQKAQLEATFLWDDTITGSDSDVQSYAAKYATLPLQMSVFVHNDQVKRQAMPAMGSGSRGSSGVGDEILAFIATSVGIPKDFFNILVSTGGNRATALVAAEPFEKVIEDLQAKFENLLLSVAEEALEDAGVGYERGDVEFIFPSVTKDTTTEAIKNIATAEELEYIDHQSAAEMVAAEMNISTYDYDETKAKIDQDRQEKMANDPLGVFGAGDTMMTLPDGTIVKPPPSNGKTPPEAPGADGIVPQNSNPLHGSPKKALKDQLKTL